MASYPADRTLLRELAMHVAEIAALPVQQETIALWKALNGLKPVRPMVVIHSVPWNEMDVDGELTLHTADPFCRGIETSLRRILYCWRHMPADMTVEPAFLMPKVILSSGIGVSIHETTEAIDPAGAVVSHRYVDQLATDADVEKIRAPTISFDAAATAMAEERTRDIFEGILPVRMQGWLPEGNDWPGQHNQPLGPEAGSPEWRNDRMGGYHAWDEIVEWRGAENVLFDLADRPEHMLKTISRVAAARMAMLDEVEQRGLLGYGQSSVGVTGGYTDELPAPGFDPDHPRARDLWATGAAQIFTSVSRAMFKEFELPFATEWFSRFGLGYYGCCEALDDRIDLIRTMPNVRKISMSPMANVERGAAEIGPDYVFSRKPNPAFVATDTWDADLVERDLRATIDACAAHGTPLELILKDISTVRYQPQRLWEWARIAMRLVGA